MKKDCCESVLHDWVCCLTFTQQALLLLSTRGPDGIQKETPAKRILHYLRGAIIKPAYEDFQKCDGFMNVDYGEPRDRSIHSHKVYPALLFGWKFEDITKEFFKDVDSYPLHFYMHLVHASEVIGYHYPDSQIRSLWNEFYVKCCNGLHMNIETQEQLDQRLNK